MIKVTITVNRSFKPIHPTSQPELDQEFSFEFASASQKLINKTRANVGNVSGNFKYK